MKRVYTYLALALLAASCARTEQSEQAAPSQIIITASFSNEQPNKSALNKNELNESELNASEIKSETPTKSTATAFEAGDELGLFVVRSGQEIQSTNNLVNNAKLVVAKDGAIKGQPDPIYYPTKTTTSLYSYYPYQSGHASADALGVHVGIRTDQTDLSQLKLSDFCFGSKLNITASNTAQAITFTHRFAQLTLNITAFEEIKAVRLLNIKDSARLNIQTGAVTLRDHTAEIVPHKTNSTTTTSTTPSTTSPTATAISYTAIIPAQTLTGACIAIDLKDGKRYTYNAVKPIALTQSATNTLNLTIHEKGIITLNGTAEITAWTSNTNSGTISESINNQITLMWLAPHAQFASADKVVLTIVDLFNNKREVEAVPVVDPKSTAEYAVYIFDIRVADLGYPSIISTIKIYAGSTLLRDCISTAIVGSTITKTGAHTMGIYPWISIFPSEDWLNVAHTKQERVITVTPSGTASWSATSDNAALTIVKSANTATLTWAENTDGARATTSRTANVTFSTIPSGATTATLKTTQLGVTPPANSVRVNGLWWAAGNLVADGANSCKIGAPGDGGLYFQYGGLIGYKGGANGDGTGVVDAVKHNDKFWDGATSYSANDISVTPTGYTSSKTTWPYFENVNAGGFGYYYYNSFVTKYADFQSQANAYNVAQGIGDPCKHYLGGDWRLPTYIELSAITGNASECAWGSWVPWSTADVTGRWEKTGPQSALGAWFGPNSRTGTPAVATDLFIPASGYRTYSSGAFYCIGTSGYVWSSSVVDYYSGFYLANSSGGVMPHTSNPRACAFPVRCVSAS